MLRVCLAAGWVGVQDRARYLKAGGGGGAGGVRGPRNQSIAVGEGSEGGGGGLPQVGAASGSGSRCHVGTRQISLTYMETHLQSLRKRPPISLYLTVTGIFGTHFRRWCWVTYVDQEGSQRCSESSPSFPSP